jgi:hypothetical protein
MSGAPQARQGAARFIVCADLHLCVGKLSARVRQRGAQAAVLFLEHELVELLTAIHGTKRPKTAGVEDAPLPLRMSRELTASGSAFTRFLRKKQRGKSRF